MSDLFLIIIKSDQLFLRKRLYCGYLFLFSLVSGSSSVLAADAVEFNTDVLDVKERSHVDLSRFSQAGYVTPGTYQLSLRVNKREVPEQTVQFMAPDNDPKGSQACFTPELVKKLGLKADAEAKLAWWHDRQCLDLSSLKGTELRADLGEERLYVSVPQAYLEYASDNWDPPSSWDNGVPGVIFDYNFNAQSISSQDSGDDSSVTGNGATGMNLGPWRFRAEWQSDYDNPEQGSSRQNWDWTRYYAYRALPMLGAKLTLGEDYLSSSVFDSFRYTGGSLVTDDNMLPPNLRGYAPEVSGVARTNAKVTISQQGRVIYETQVPPGPFRIQDLNNAINGTLDVTIRESDGSTQSYQIDTANVPYLTRPGMVRYRVAAGQPSDTGHHGQGPGFGSGEFSWGISNGWSLYGGTLLAGDYNALSLGIGRDLLILGALSFDVTESRASIPDQDTLQGGSYRLSYSKRFEETASQVSFAGYRFTERDFMSMSDYLTARYDEDSEVTHDKELYTVTFNQFFEKLKVNAYLSYSHRTYWDEVSNDSWNLSLSGFVDLWQFKNTNVSVTWFRNSDGDEHDDGMYVSVSVPWGDNGTLSYDGQYGSGDNSNMVGYYGRMDDNNSWQLKAGESGSSAAGSGYFTHDGNMAEMTVNGSYQGSDYHALGMSLQGGVTATAQGMALHRNSKPGGTRMMVDTGDVGDVPVRGYFGGVTETNRFGKAVITDISEYYRNSVSVDLNRLPEDVDATSSVVEGTLTEGAIGYRKLSVTEGQKAMAVIRLPDGSFPPFGAVVMNDDQTQTGIVGDDGSTWLTGIKAGASAGVVWDGKEQCRLSFPAGGVDVSRMLLLPCVAGGVSLAEDKQ